MSPLRMPNRQHGQPYESRRSLARWAACVAALAWLTSLHDAVISQSAFGRFEGRYEYENGQTITFATSPKDGALVAIIGDAKYPLTHEGADTFRAASGDRVRFDVTPTEALFSYLNRAAGPFRRLDTTTAMPRRAWYPRLPEDVPTTRAARPRESGDGLIVGGMEDAGLDPVRIEAMVKQIAGGAYPDVHSVLVARHGRLVVEEYFYEYDGNTRHQMRSATKSVISTLVGIAIERKLIGSVTDPLLPYFARVYPTIANLDERKRRITIEDLMTNQSGLDCDDRNPASPGGEGRLYQSADWVKWVLDLQAVAEPGRVAHYCSGGPMVLARLIEVVSGVSLETFANRELFQPLGMTRVPWVFAPNPTQADSFGQVTLLPREMLKLGLTIAGNGRWHERQVVPASWVTQSTASHSTVDNTDYGYLWWRPYLNTPAGRRDAVLATGNGGQKIYIFSDLDLVVVMTGGNYNSQSPSNELVSKFILPAN